MYEETMYSVSVTPCRFAATKKAPDRPISVSLSRFAIAIAIDWE
jgi:hypothetical protein